VLPLEFSETTQIDQRKKTEKPRQSEINFNTITNLNKFKVYTSTCHNGVWDGQRLSLYMYDERGHVNGLT